MRTTLVGLSIFAATVVAAPAMADDAAAAPSSPWTVTGGATLTSDYRFRGVSQTNKRFAIQGTIGVSHSSGFYVGTWGSSIDDYVANGGDQEIDLYAGYKKTISGTTIDGGVLYYYYPGSGGVTSDFFEPYLNASHTFGPVTGKVGLNYAWKQHGLSCSYDARCGGKPFKFQRQFGSYVIENVQFKIAYPTAFHGQTGVEAAIKLHPLVKDQLEDIESIDVKCHNSTMVILDKTGPLANPADRDHCMQYMMAVGLIFGKLTTEDYEDHVASDPRIDALRAKMHLAESPVFEREYHDPAKRTNANSIQVHFKNGTKTPVSQVDYPLGHVKRRKEGIPLLIEKFEKNVARVFAEKQRRQIVDLCLDRKRVAAMPVNEFINVFV